MHLSANAAPLSSPAWKTIPFTKTPKTARDALFDILVDIPDLLEDLDILISLPHDFKRSYGPRELDDLAARGFFDDNNTSNELPSKPTARDIAVAHIMAYYWTASFTAKPKLSERTEPRPYCMQIASTVDILSHTSAGMSGTHSTPLPIGMCVLYLSSTEERGTESKEGQRFMDFFKRKQGQGGEIGKLLSSLLGTMAEVAEKELTQECSKHHQFHELKGIAEARLRDRTDL
ncbi:hypothetical protein B0H63DRAFT_522822 [Podospora didyma]|uniref:Uncharacterized protein n=1 Tax=Podospora didyma TaxID=330526 RepID=A0AAE0TZL4_9PEZI|nr:hypothetical protein B0H63DRAFT_522822 [Podospora didyma]